MGSSYNNLMSPVQALVNSFLSYLPIGSSSLKEEKYQVLNTAELCAERKLSTTLFHNQTMELKDDVAKHAAWMYRNIYSIPYGGLSKDAKADENLARPDHGIQHVTRTAMYVPIFVNLYRRYKDREALALDATDVKLLQIAMLLHDSARMSDDKDYWDRESGIFVYEYLTRVLKVNANKAKMLAEAVTTNKDPKEGKYYYKITVINDGSYRCEKTAYTKKNIYQRIIQNADCFDIMRVREVFVLDYSDFFLDIGSKNNKAFEEVTHLITEIRSLIALHGDDFDFPDMAKKKELDNENYYSELMKCVFDLDNEITANYKIIRGLYHAVGAEVNKDLLGYLLEKKSATEEKLSPQLLLEKQMRSGRLLARVIDPTSEVKRPRKAPETGIGFEVRKIKRRIGVETRSKSDDRTKKLGFDTRSTSMIGYGGTLFNWGHSGYLFVPEMQHIQSVSSRNCNSGFGKKAKREPLKDAEKQLKDLNKTLKKGGDPEAKESRHTEVICRVTEAHAVFYSCDAVSPDSGYKATVLPQLNAILIQKEFQNQMSVDLPIVRYSYKHNMIKVRQFNHSVIKELWRKLFNDYLEKLNDTSVLQLDLTLKKLNDIKEYSVGAKYCANYDEKLKTEIDGVLEKEVREKIFKSYRNNEALLVKAISKGKFIEQEYNELLAQFSINAQKFTDKLMECIKDNFNHLNLEVTPQDRHEYLDNILNLYRFAVRFNFLAQENEVLVGMEEAISLAILDAKADDRIIFLKSRLKENSYVTHQIVSNVAINVYSKINWNNKHYKKQLCRAERLFPVYENRQFYTSFKKFYTLEKISQLDQNALDTYCIVANSFAKFHPDICVGNYHLLINNILMGKYVEDNENLSRVLTLFDINEKTLDAKLRVTVQKIIKVMNEKSYPLGFGMSVELTQLKALYRYVDEYNFRIYKDEIKKFMASCQYNKKFKNLIPQIGSFFKKESVKKATSLETKQCKASLKI